MAEAVVSIALETLSDLVFEEARFLSGVSGEVMGIQTLLKEMKCLLKDADKRQHESELVRNWIAEIKDVAHRAEDAIETYAVEVSSKRGRGLKQLLRRFSCILNEGFSLHQIGSEISEIKSEVARVTEKMKEYGIRNIIQGESSTFNHNDENQKWQRQTFSSEIEDCFVGKEDELKRLVSLIVDDKQHRVISIWGMGGIGKTTIARRVYNHIDTKRFFDSFAWVCITQQCRIRSVLEDVLKQLIPQKRDDISSLTDTELIPQKRDDISSLTDTELIQQLCQIQKAKRCMIVLDDLWKSDHWDGLKHAFLVQGLNSKILVTTRKQKVADHMGLAFERGLLSVDDGWELLKEKAFPDGNIADSAFEGKLLQKIGKEMVHKCGYLPLVISLLGGILSKKKSMSEWELVNENINAHLYRGDGIEKEKEIHEVLNLSYEDLPYYLKPCLLYIGQFGEDQSINVRPLYMMWIAQGMISHENQGKEKTLMDIAELYLSELASRCIVQVEVEDNIPGRKYRSCKLHDVMRELCLSKGKEEDLGFQVLNYQDGKFSNLLHESLSGIKTRYLAIHFEREKEIQRERDELITITRVEDARKHVRSLQFFNHNHEETIEFPHTVVDLQKFKWLRMLVFERFNFARRKLPRAICHLIHLRHLRLRACELDRLPSSISNLVYLYTLDLGESLNVRVPKVLKKMCRLRHLFLPLYEMEAIENCRLRLDEGLDELETLVGFNSLVHELKSITRIKNLQSLAATVYDNESLSAIIDAITTNWKNLQFCKLTIKHSCQFTFVEEGLVNLKKLFTCPNLHDLTIGVQLGKLLEECRKQIITSKLTILFLLECEIEDDPMEILGNLPFLKELRFFKRSFVGEEMKCHALGFPQLKNLVLKDLPNLREWRVEQGAMPILSEIEINGCPHLKMVPDGLRFIGTLQKLTISQMPELGKRVSNEGGEDFDKVRNVPSIIIIGD